MKLLKLFLIFHVFGIVVIPAALGIYAIDELGKDSLSAENICMLIVFFFPLIICMLILGLKLKKNRRNIRRCKDLQSSMLTVPTFTPVKFISNYEMQFVFAIDDKQKKVAYATKKERHFWSYEDIISVELIDTEFTLFKKSTVRMVGGALLGGIIGGDSGAAVGGLSGDYKKQNLHKSVKIKILLRDVNNPSVIITCMKFSSPVKENNKTYKKAIACATDIADTLKVVIDNVDVEYKKATLRNTATNSISITDELSKLMELRKSGVLSELEFINLKAKFLNYTGYTGVDDLCIEGSI